MEEVSVYLDVVLPFFRHIAIGVDGRNGALGLTEAAIYALIGVDEEHVVNLVVLCIDTFMDAIHGANRHAGLILHADTGLGNNIGHRVMFSSGSSTIRLGNRRLLIYTFLSKI